MLGDGLVHHRLGERGLVPLVVAVAAVADEVDQEVAPEALAVFPGKAGRLEAGHRIVGIDVHDGNLEPAGDAARVTGAVGLVGCGREAELVVRDDVNRAARIVAGEAGQVQRFRHDALAGERGITVNQDRQRHAAIEARRAWT